MHIIFDFDGTIVDSFDYVLNFLASEAKKKLSTKEERDAYRAMSMKDIALRLHIPFWRLPLLYFKGRKVMRAHMDNLKFFNGVDRIIKELDSNGHKLYIVSANSTKNIKKFLLKKSLNEYFWDVRGGAGLLGKDNLIRKFKRKHKMNSNETWYVGDEARDVAAARAGYVKSAAVTWGFASLDELKNEHPDLLIYHPKELLIIGEESAREIA